MGSDNSPIEIAFAVNRRRRIQYRRPRDISPELLTALGGESSHPDWPKTLCKESISLSSWALHVLYIYCRQHERGFTWHTVQGSKAEVLKLRLPEAPKKPETIDFKGLDATDVTRVAHLLTTLPRNLDLKPDVLINDDAVMRCAVALVNDLYTRLEISVTRESGSSERSHVRLVAKRDEEEKFVPLPLMASAKRAPSAKKTTPLQGGEIAGKPAGDDAESLDLLDKEELLAAVFTVTVANRWLTTHAAKVTRLAQSGANQSIGFEQDYELQKLLVDFWSDVTGDSPTLLLRDELFEHRLLPKDWRENATVRASVLAKKGYEQIQSYLQSRMRNTDDPLRPSLRTGDIPTPPLTTIGLNWRNWTRSSPHFEHPSEAKADSSNAELAAATSAEGTQPKNGQFYREIAAPLDWLAVVRHTLIKRSGESRAMVWHDLQHWLSLAYDVSLRDAAHIEAACHAYNAHFYGATPKQSRAHTGHRRGDDKLDLDDLLRMLRESSEDAHRVKVAQFLYLWLTALRVINPIYRWKAVDYNKSYDKDITYQEADKRFRSLTSANVSELKAWIFGGPSAIDGMRTIMRGGILPREKRGRTWLISGSPGSGKSTFALNLASDMARRGRVAVVVCADENVDAVYSRLRTFGLLDPKRYEVLDAAKFQERLIRDAMRSVSELLASPVTQPKGILVVFGASAVPAATEDQAGETLQPDAGVLDLDDWLRTIKIWVDLIKANLAAAISDEQIKNNPLLLLRLRAEQRCWRWVSVLIDSIDELELSAPETLASGWPSGDSAAARRPALAGLVHLIEECRFWGLLVCGRSHRDRDALSYLADAVLELGTEHSSELRTLTIHKCRTQPYDPGAHLIQLVEGIGTVIHPNLASTQREVRRRARRSIDSEHLIPIPDYILWDDRDLDKPPQRPVRSDRPTLTARRGASVLLYGQPASGKGPFAFNLMSERMQLPRDFWKWRLGASGGVLVVSFRGDERDCLRRFEDASELRKNWAQNVSYLQLQWYGADISLRAPHIAHELYRSIQRARLERLPLDWIVFLDVEAVQTHMPAIDAEPNFWPTILAVTNSEQISTVFIVNGKDNTNSFLARHRQDMDYILHFSAQGEQRSAIIEKSADHSQGAKLSFAARGGVVTTS